jgi:la-related protein 6
MNVSSKAMNSSEVKSSTCSFDIETATQTTLHMNESESNNSVVLNGPAMNENQNETDLVQCLENDDQKDLEVSAIDSSDDSGDEGICDVTDHIEFFKYNDATSSTSFTYVDYSNSSPAYLQPKIKVAVIDEFPMIEESKSENDGKYDEEMNNQASSSDVEGEILLLESTRSDDSRSDDSSSQEKTLVNQTSFEDSDTVNKNESDDDLVIPPDNDMCAKIAEQVEFYFSDRSLLRDAFLLKHVRRNKEGFVSLKLVSSFKRVRNLCKDWRAVGIAIKHGSKEIELNDLGTKVRRKTPLPSHDETLPSRTIVATNLPLEKLTIERVSEMFSKCGEIALIRILRPDCCIPSDVKHFVSKHPELQQNECALVEFIESSAARKALEMENVTVLELVLPKKKTGKKASYVTKIVETVKYNNGSRENERLRGGDYIDGAHNQSIGFGMCSRRSSSVSNENDAIKICQQLHQKHFEAPLQQRRKINSCSPIPFSSNRKYSNCSDGFSSNYSESYSSRRQSYCSDYPKHLSYCIDMEKHPSTSRRSSIACSDVCSCGAPRKMSTFSNDSSYRRFSNGSIASDYSRKFSNASLISNDERKYSLLGTPECRRISFPNDFNHRVIPLNTPYKYNRRNSSGTTDLASLSRKNSVNKYEYYENGRKVSTDSGYDRRTSIQSTVTDIDDINISRKNSLMNENFIRKPIGPDDLEGKGFDFAMRTRKFGMTESSSIVS